MLGFGRAAELGVGVHGCHEMARHVYLGDDLNVAFLGVGHHVAQFLLRVEVGAVGCVRIVAAPLPVPLVAVGGDAAHARQSGPFLYLDAPALVVAQVPVETVHLVDGHEVDHLLHLVDREEVACHVEHEAAVGKARLVHDAHQGEAVRSDAGRGLAEGHAGGQQFLQRLKGVEEAGRRPCLHGDAAGRDVEPVAFGVQIVAFVALHADEGLARPALHAGVEAGGGVDGGHEALRFDGQAVGQFVGRNDELFRQGERSLSNAHLLGLRRQVDESLGPGHGGQQAQRDEQR